MSNPTGPANARDNLPPYDARNEDDADTDEDDYEDDDEGSDDDDEDSQDAEEEEGLDHWLDIPPVRLASCGRRRARDRA